MAHTEEYRTVIKLNNEDAKQKIDELKKEIEDLRIKQKGYTEDSVKYKNVQKEIDKLTSKLEATENATKKVNSALSNISAAKPKELRDTIRQINALMNTGTIQRGSEEWKALTEAQKLANTELAKIRTETKASQPIMAKFFKFLNDSWGGILILAQTISGVTMTIRKSVEDYAQMEEEMADVRKYTGLAGEKVRELNEDFKKMDTRTSREQLNQLAGSAGRLGLQSTKDIKEFVEAADMIGVALGDDLGDGAVDKIGKLAMAFGEDENKGLKAAMLSTGSAINELAQNSSAKADFLVEFTARVAGFGKQLGLTQAQIMGFGTVMDENLLKDEMAATAFGNMLTKMQTDTSKFAKIAGMDVKEFADLLNKDANAAVLALADSLKKADPQTMMKMLDSMGLDGSRAVAVLATMADKIDDVRKHQVRATEAYEKATSVGNEFNVMNNTVQARIDKCKKSFKEMTIELGERLLPVVQHTITGAGLLTKALSILMEWLDKYKISIATTATTIAILYGWHQKMLIVEKLSMLIDTKLMPSLKRLGTFLKTNWVGVSITLLTALATAIWEVKRRSDGLSESERNLKKIRDNAKKSIVEEEQRLRALIAAAADEKISMDKRKIAVDELNRVIPNYNAQLDETTGKYQANKKALDDYLNSLVRKYEIEGARERLQELGKDLADAEVNLKKAQETADKLKNTGPSTGGQGDVFFNVGQKMGANQAVNNAQKVVDGIKNQIGAITKAFGEDLKEQAIEAVVEVKEEPVKPGGDFDSDEDKKKLEREREREERERLKEAENAAKAAADANIAAKTHEYAMGKIAYRQYIQDIAKLQQEGLRNRRDVYQEGTAEYEKLNRQLEEMSFKGDQKVNQMKLEDLQRCMLRQQAEIEAQAAREEITETEKQERLRMLNESFLADKVVLYKEGSKERLDAEWELEQTEQRNRIEREKEYQQQLDYIRQEYLGMSNEKQLQIALSGLERMHQLGLISEEEYQRAIIAIRAQYANAQTPAEHTQGVANDMLTNARNAAAPTESSMPIVGTIQNYKTLMEKLQDMYGEDEKNHEAYLMAKQQATAQFCESLASEIQAAYSSVNQVMQAASSLFSAQQEYETAMVQKKYEKQIAAAGNNQKKVKKLQEQQQKEEAAIKTKYNRKQVKIQIAQAIAQTAVNALNAYGSAAAVPVIGHVLAPIAAAMATAAGMIQVAAIQKQAQAQEAGYYEGGFTGGRRYRRKAGVVHEGEFVANHQAVNNPNVMPFLNFLDQAQRNNTVGSLTAEDVSRSMGAGGSAQVVTPIVNVQNDTKELQHELSQSREVNSELLTIIKTHGIHVDFPMDSFDKSHKHYLKLNER